jgi:4-azaleucine resistance transporter AzlC
MKHTTGKSFFVQGVAHGGPFFVVVVPFALLFGVIGTEAGLSIAEVMGFSVLVIAGAAQFTAIQLMVEDAPTLIVLAVSLAVNLRMAMYSAAVTPHLGGNPIWKRGIIAYLLVDQSYAISVMKYEDTPDMTVQEKTSYFFGVIVPIFPMWYAGTWLGAVAGKQIPPEWALDFAVPVAFIALVAPALKTGAHITAAAVSVIAVLVFSWMPYNTGLLVAGVLAMAAGAEVERRREAS